MKLVPFLVLALVACKSHKPAAKAAAGSAVVATPAAPAAKAAPTAAPAAPYVAPTAPDDEVVPQQAVAAATGSAVAPVVHRDPVLRQFDKLDTNHDGKLTPDEVKQHFPDDLDTNGDGEISKQELEVGMREKRIRARGSHVH